MFFKHFNILILYFQIKKYFKKQLLSQTARTYMHAYWAPYPSSASGQHIDARFSILTANLWNT